MKILVRFSWLRITSALIVNLAAGLILLMFTIRDWRVLILDGLFVIVSLVISARIEDILEDYV